MALSTLSPILLEQTSLSIPTSFTLLHLTLIKKSKTDPFWETARLTIARSNSDLCASTALRDYMLQTTAENPGQPLFSFSYGPNLTRTSPTNNFWTLLNLCDIDSSSYASHSFRIGAATTARATCIPDWLVKFWVAGKCIPSLRQDSQRK